MVDLVDSANTRATRVVVPVALRALEAQRLVALIAFKVSPALAAGLIAYVHMGDVGSALLVATAMVGALQLVERSTLPLGLMPAARLGLCVCAPVLGAGAAAALALAAGEHMALADLEAPVAGAWLIMGLGVWVTARFDDDRRHFQTDPDGPDHGLSVASRSRAARSRASVRSRPRTCSDSNSGGPTDRPVTATRIGACALPSFRPCAVPTASNALFNDSACHAVSAA